MCNLQNAMSCYSSRLSFPRACITYRTSYGAIDPQILLTQPLPTEDKDFPRGGKYPKHVCLLTYLAYLRKVFVGRIY